MQKNKKSRKENCADKRLPKSQFQFFCRNIKYSICPRPFCNIFIQKNAGVFNEELRMKNEETGGQAAKSAQAHDKVCIMNRKIWKFLLKNKNFKKYPLFAMQTLCNTCEGLGLKF